MPFISKMFRFLDAQQQSGSGMDKPLFQFKLLWKQSILATLAVALLPLIALAVIDYSISKEALESETLLRTARLVSNARRTLTSYLDERRFALNFLVFDNSYEQLVDEKRLALLLEHLKNGLGEWSDLGVIDHQGIQRNYAGPYNVEGMDYSKQEWYQNLNYTDKDNPTDPSSIRSDISDVFLGFRHLPHLVISVLHKRTDGQNYILRASLDIDRLSNILRQLEVSGNGDAFLLNHTGVIQTPSRDYGAVLSQFPMTVPAPSEHTEVLETVDQDGREIIVGYAYITGTPFILMVVKKRRALLQSLEAVSSKLLLFLAGSILTIVGVVFGICTYLVNSIYLADEKRVATLHQVEYANKMASIGRLSAGVAHEINNPLAIINEKAGLLKDLFTLKKEYAVDTRLLGLVDSIIHSVERCAMITKQLLNFARNLQASMEKVCIKEVVQDVLEFQTKEAANRNITIAVNLAEDIPDFFCDRGKLQQVVVNLVNNAFAAMKDGGNLQVEGHLIASGKRLLLRIRDDGCGIPPENIQKIFEPFFTTKSGRGGTGLGLSITYGLVKEIGGDIYLESKVGKGTTFTLTLPLNHRTEGEHDACTAG